LTTDEIKEIRKLSVVEERKGKIVRQIRSDSLKIIAMVCMFLDHIGCGILERYLLVVSDPKVFSVLEQVNESLRGIGRLAMPIFCYQIVVGMMHTRDRLKYLGSLLLFALISEVPYDLLFGGEMVNGGFVYKAFDFRYQNVMFTLLLGAAVIYAYEVITEGLPFFETRGIRPIGAERAEGETFVGKTAKEIREEKALSSRENKKYTKEKTAKAADDKYNIQANTDTETRTAKTETDPSSKSASSTNAKTRTVIAAYALNIAIFAALALTACVIAEKIYCDYGAMGVLLILIFYIFRNDRQKMVVYGVVLFLIEIVIVTYIRTKNPIMVKNYMMSEAYACLAFPFIMVDNGQRTDSRLFKLVGYAFYPAHILLILVVNMLIW